MTVGNNGRDKRILNVMLSTLKSFSHEMQLEEMSENGRKRAQLNARLQEKLHQQKEILLSREEKEWQEYLQTMELEVVEEGGWMLTESEPRIYFKRAI